MLVYGSSAISRAFLIAVATSRWCRVQFPVTRRARVVGLGKLRLLATAATASPWLANDASAPPLEGARFLIEAVAGLSEAPELPPRAVVDWRDSLVRVIGTFERLERAQRFGA